MSKPTEMSLASYFNLEEYADLIFLAEKKEVYCCRQLFEYYSPKFKKLYSSSVNGSHSSSPSPTIVRLDHAKLATVYFLVQQLFHSFTLPLSNISEPILIDLMTLAQKFQIRELQALCEVHITITFDNFSKLYDYSRNCELLGFREELLKFFVIHSQTIIEIMPIGKVEELIRLVYSPECQHASEIELSAKIEANYKVRNSESGQTKEYPRYINYSGIVKN